MYFITIVLKTLLIIILAFLSTNGINILCDSKFVEKQRRKRLDKFIKKSGLTEDDLKILREGIDLNSKKGEE